MSPAPGPESHGAPGPDETLDRIQGVWLLQHRRGHRCSMDALLLARFARSTGMRGPVIELGAGSGIIPLLLAKTGAEVVGLELQGPLFDLAVRNVRLNRAEDRVSLVRGDLREIDRLLPPGGFRHVVCNPPFHAGAGPTSPVAERAIAHHALTCSLQDVVRAARHLLASAGSLCLILPAARLPELLATVQAHGFCAAILQWVHPRPGAPAHRVLVRAVKEGRARLQVLAPRFLEAGPPPRRRLQPAAQAL